MPTERIKTTRGWRVRGYCECGWVGKSREILDGLLARQDVADHRAKKHRDGEPALKKDPTP